MEIDNNNNMSDGGETRGYPWLVAAGALLIVALLSVVPWSALTGGYIKDFNLIGDIVTGIEETLQSASDEPVDPELIKALEEGASSSSDQGREASCSPEESDQEETALNALGGRADSVMAASLASLIACPGRVNGQMVIEDYTPGQNGLERLKQALASGTARIAVLGDSYIEGDIFTQDVRSLLQEQYGGRGVGYVPPYSPIAGFRRSVNVNGTDAWQEHGLSSGKQAYLNIAGQYFTAGTGATVRYTGNKKNPTTAAWQESKVLFIAPVSGSITLITDTDTLKMDVAASPDPQQALIQSETKKLTIKSNIPGIVFLGAWLTDGHGITVDCMSVRGDSGISHKKINADLAQKLRPFVDYDLIVLEYGINALTAQQTNYSGYANLMVEVIEKMRECYPNADIMMLGVGDRGQKSVGEVHSISTIGNMVKCQREAAQKAQCLFWDTREAMGGADAIVDWRQRGLANGDYIHLNHDGGRELANEFVKSLNLMLAN